MAFAHDFGAPIFYQNNSEFFLPAVSPPLTSYLVSLSRGFSGKLPSLAHLWLNFGTKNLKKKKFTSRA